MTRLFSLRSALAASVCLLPLQALAQSDDGFDVGDKPAAAATQLVPDNWVTLGGQYNSGRSYYLGRYSGTVDPGFSGLGDLHVGQRDAWDSGGTNYWEVDGKNLGFWDRSLTAKMGQQGTWGLNFYYDSIPYYATNSFKSVYQSNGLLVPGVAPGSLAVNYTQLLPKNGILNSLWIPQAVNSPSANLFNFDISTRRDIFGGGGKYQWGDWTVTAAWKHEHKEGTYANSMEIGGAPAVTTAGSGATKPTAFTSGLAYFAQPIDYDMDRFDITAAYGNERVQTQFGYTYSQFNDNSTAFNMQNPFAFTPTSSFGGPVTNISTIYALPPSNSAHQFKGQFGYNFDPYTRLNVNLGYGLQMQNDPYSSGIGNTNIPPQAEPQGSLGGLVQTFFGNIAFTARPLPKLDIRLAYTMDDRENQTAQHSYLVYPTSTTNTSFTYLNLPYSYQHQSGVLEAGYRLGPQTKITLSDTVDYTHRTYANTSNVTSNTIAAKLRGPLTDNVFGSLSAAHQDRQANNYNANAGYQQLCNGCNTEPANFLMFFEASRKHDEVKGTIDVSPTSTVTASMIAKFSKDNYPSGNYGLRNNYNVSVGPDVSWQVSNSLTAHAYYTYQQIYYNQSSVYQSPGAPSTPVPTAGNTQYIVQYNAKTTDAVHTFGATTDWQAIPDVLKLSLDYNFSYGNTAYALGEGMVAYGGSITSPTFAPSISMQSLPDVKSMLSVISMHGEYTFRPNMTLLFGYAWERFTYKDFMMGSSATQYANALLPGTVVPNDSVHVVSAALRIRF